MTRKEYLTNYTVYILYINKNQSLSSYRIDIRVYFQC